MRSAFPGNVIPANRFDPVGKKIVSLYPEPNLTTAGSVNWQNNFFLNDNVTWYNFHNIVERVDHNFSEKERVYGRFVWNDQLLHQNSNGLQRLRGRSAGGPQDQLGRGRGLRDRPQPEFHLRSPRLHDPLGAELQADELGQLQCHGDRLAAKPGKSVTGAQPLSLHNRQQLQIHRLLLQQYLVRAHYHHCHCAHVHYDPRPPRAENRARLPLDALRQLPIRLVGRHHGIRRRFHAQQLLSRRIR